jgi:branched-chain amino acid transport system substrate-binding protein
MRRLRQTAAAGVALLAVTAAAACSSSGGGSGSSGSGGTYNIGFIDSLSGLVGPYAQGQLKGAQAYVSYINSHGGINGKKISLSVLDDGSDPARSVSDTLQMIRQNHVLMITGFASSDNCDAALPAASKAEVSLLCISAGRNLLDPPNPHLFVSQVDVGDEVATEFALAKQLVKSATPRLAIVSTDLASNVSLRSGLEQSATAAGWKVVANEIIPGTASDVSTYVNAIVASKPDVVLGAINESPAVVLVRSLNTAGENVPVIDYNGGDDVATLQSVNNPDFYVVREYSYGFPSFTGSGVTTFMQATNSAHVNPNQTFVVNGYFQMLVIADALKKCGASCTSTQLTAAMTSLNTGTGGLTAAPIAFSSTSHTALHGQFGFTWDPTTSQPKEVATYLAAGNVYPAGSGG